MTNASKQLREQMARNIRAALPSLPAPRRDCWGADDSTDQMRAYGEACAAAAVAAEREACAKVAENTATCLLPTGSFLSEKVAAAIRARSNT